MRIGLDFDNTIACYDREIARLAEEIFELPDTVAMTKLGLREYLRKENREQEWTAFQGELYGPGMRYAEVYEGAIEVMLELEAAGHELFVISHRSKTPYAGPAYDLHASAKTWLKKAVQNYGLLNNEHVFFLETRSEKIQIIRNMSCDVFLDDLPEVLEASEFPVVTQGILFAPNGVYGQSQKHTTICSWKSLPALL